LKKLNSYFLNTVITSNQTKTMSLVQDLKDLQKKVHSEYFIEDPKINEENYNATVEHIRKLVISKKQTPILNTVSWEPVDNVYTSIPLPIPNAYTIQRLENEGVHLDIIMRSEMRNVDGNFSRADYYTVVAKWTHKQ
jgi:hypothetical protein